MRFIRKVAEAAIIVLAAPPLLAGIYKTCITPAYFEQFFPERRVPPEVLERLWQKSGLDQSWLALTSDLYGRLFRMDFGERLRRPEPIAEGLLEATTETAFVMSSAFALAFSAGLLIAVAVWPLRSRHRTFTALRGISLVPYPVFLLLLLQVFTSLDLPTSSYLSEDADMAFRCGDRPSGIDPVDLLLHAPAWVRWDWILHSLPAIVAIGASLSWHFAMSWLLEWDAIEEHPVLAASRGIGQSPWRLFVERVRLGFAATAGPISQLALELPAGGVLTEALMGRPVGLGSGLANALLVEGDLNYLTAAVLTLALVIAGLHLLFGWIRLGARGESR